MLVKRDRSMQTNREATKTKENGKVEKQIFNYENGDVRYLVFCFLASAHIISYLRLI